MADGRGDRPGPAEAPALDASAGTGPAVAPWRVFGAVDPAAPGGNRLANADFARGSATEFEGWGRFGAGYEVDLAGGRGGGRGLRLSSAGASEVHAASATVMLGQGEARPILVSGWSRAQDVTGEPDGDYSLYLDCDMPTEPPGTATPWTFEVGSHDWQLRDRVLVPSRPVQSLTVYCMFRSKHTGMVWFDDRWCARPAASCFSTGSWPPPLRPPDRGPVAATVASAEGLELGFSDGGAMARVAAGGRPVPNEGQAHLGGFFLRDVRARGDWIHPGGPIAPRAWTPNTPASCRRLACAFTPVTPACRIASTFTPSWRTPGARTARHHPHLRPACLRLAAWTWGDRHPARSGPIAGAGELTQPQPRVGHRRGGGTQPLSLGGRLG